MKKLDVGAEVRAINRAIASMIAKAKAAGVVDPLVYFEGQGSVNVVDQDHPDWRDHDGSTAVVARGRLVGPMGAGGW